MSSYTISREKSLRSASNFISHHYINSFLDSWFAFLCLKNCVFSKVFSQYVVAVSSRVHIGWPFFRPTPIKSEKFVSETERRLTIVGRKSIESRPDVGYWSELRTLVITMLLNLWIQWNLRMSTWFFVDKKKNKKKIVNKNEIRNMLRIVSHE